MALSATVWNPLRLSQARGNCRELSGHQLTHHVCALGLSTGKGLSGLVTVRRLQWRRQRGQDERVVVRASENNSSNETGETSSEADVEALEARLGVGRRARRQQQAESGGNPQAAPAKPTKAWDAMSLAEKAWSVYIDPDKGVLFWLNKLAYGAIFAIIGGWIIFRFIGPTLGWYELDKPLLSPDRILDGGS